jgi:glucokinase
MTPVVAGIDLGGTGSRFVIQGAAGLLAATTLQTAELGAGDAAARVARLGDLLEGLVPTGTRLAAIGIGATGPVDIATGIINNHDTLPWFSEFPLTAVLATRFGLPVVIDNDAVVAAVAEWRLGAGAGVERMLMVTLGTGIGVAFLTAGRPFRGPGGVHPEAGHIPILPGRARCYCGADGCWEQLASRGALQATLRPLLQDTPGPLLIQEAGRRAGDDPAIARLLAEYGNYFGRGLSVLHSLYRPEVTVIGGSVAPLLPILRPAVEATLARTPAFAVPHELRSACLDDNAGAVGAALMAAEACGLTCFDRRCE